MPLINELLPLPDTPVTHVTTPSGMSTSMSFRLWYRAPRIVSLNSSMTGRSLSGTAISRRPDRN